jgi:hypothetical protein
MQEAVRALSFAVDLETNKVSMIAGAISGGEQAFYAPLIDSINRANTLWDELGFTKYLQTSQPALFVADAQGISLTSTRVKQSTDDANNILPGGQNIEMIANHVFQIENPMGFFIASSKLTAGGNVMKTRINSSGVGQVDHDDHLVYIPNKAKRDEYNFYETNVIEWHEIHGDIQNFDLELRSHKDKPFIVDPSRVGGGGSHSGTPPFMVTLIFECTQVNIIHPTQTEQYVKEAWKLAHSQN